MTYKNKKLCENAIRTLRELILIKKKWAIENLGEGIKSTDVLILTNLLTIFEGLLRDEGLANDE